MPSMISECIFQVIQIEIAVWNGCKIILNPLPITDCSHSNNHRNDNIYCNHLCNECMHIKPPPIMLNHTQITVTYTSNYTTIYIIIQFLFIHIKKPTQIIALAIKILNNLFSLKSILSISNSRVQKRTSLSSIKILSIFNSIS